MTDEQTTPAGPSLVERVLGETEPVRRALYPVVVAVLALLVAYGYLEQTLVPLWLALAVAVLGIGGTEAARAVAWAPASVADYGGEWRAALDGEYRRGVTDGIAAAHERTPDEVATELVHDTPGEHAADRVRTEQLAAQPATTGLMRAPSRATRCREIDGGRRCALTRDHGGPHMMTTG